MHVSKRRVARRTVAGRHEVSLDGDSGLTRHSGSTSSVVRPQGGQQGPVSCSSLLYGCTVDLPAAPVRGTRGGREGEEKEEEGERCVRSCSDRIRSDQVRSMPSTGDLLFPYSSKQPDTHARTHTETHNTPAAHGLLTCILNPNRFKICISPVQTASFIVHQIEACPGGGWYAAVNPDSERFGWWVGEGGGGC
jgi:hypothetical protein